MSGLRSQSAPAMSAPVSPPAQGSGVDCDLLVVGSGAAGLATAITAQQRGLDVLVVEKEPRFGGTTVRAGGWLWVPGNSLAREAGVDDPVAQARRYIEHEAGEFFDAPRVDAFLAGAGPMVDFFRRHTQVQFNFGLNYPDYHLHQPGAAQQGRSIHPVPFDGTELGPLLERLALPMRESTFLGMGLNSGPDLKHFLNATRSLTSAVFVARRLVAHGWDVLRHGRGTRLVNGNALAARLLASAAQRGVAMWHASPVASLTQDQGRVTGAIVARGDGGTVSVRARHGVVLATGGFPHDLVRQRRYFSHLNAATRHATLAPPGNTGDGITLAESAGAAMVDRLTQPAPWAPVSLVAYADGSEGRFFHLVDRAKPGVIAVDKAGRRFVNESDSYHDFVAAMIDHASPGDEAAAFMVCDHRALRAYGLGAVLPFPLPIGRFIRSGYLMRGDTIDALARRAGIDPATLAATVSRVNRDARNGMDTEFGKGSTRYQRLLGDERFAPNPCLAPLQHGPFYAVKVIPGDLGTYLGLATTPASQVLGNDGAVIDGLFAVGNDAATVFGGSYPGAGGTLGPAMTFGFLCANFIADQAMPPTTTS